VPLSPTTTESLRGTDTALLVWTSLLGFALGGFFDGILLHQILQWHHLMSLVAGFEDLRRLVLWDGLFHLGAYLLALIALAGLWRERGDLSLTPGRRVFGAALIGFGLWHIVDAIAFHWVLQIHRIRIDSDQPLLWDLVWFSAFGLLPAAIGWRWTKVDRGPGPGFAAATGLALATVVAGVLTLLPAPSQATEPNADPSFTVIAFAPGLGPQRAIAALDRAGGRLVHANETLSLVVAQVDPAKRLGLYRDGAIMVSGTLAALGCVNWTRPTR
jgi:uncharacterized membrane protein